MSQGKGVHLTAGVVLTDAQGGVQVVRATLAVRLPAAPGGEKEPDEGEGGDRRALHHRQAPPQGSREEEGGGEDGRGQC